MTERLQFTAIGTTWQIATDTPLPLSLQNNIQKRINEFDHTYSRFRNDSLITQIATQKGTYTFPDDAKALFSLYEKLYNRTDGLFTPLIGQLLVDAGYDASYSLKPKKLGSIPSWEDVMQCTFPTLVVKKPILLDFGAAGKGYIVDIIGDLLRQHKISSFCINAGGDILYKNTQGKKLRVGLEHPIDTTKVIGVAEIENGSICASAGNRRKWKTFHHIMDPKTKKSVDGVIATWVIAESALIADGLATALFFVDPALLAKEFTFAYVVLHKDYSLEKSEHFPAEFY